LFSPSYLLVQIVRRRFVDGEDDNPDLYALACEPNLIVKLFSACLVNGVRYHTVDREKNRRTQNSGVMVEGTHDGENVEFYGSLEEIIELRYNLDSGDQRTVVLFRCHWYDTNIKKARMKDDGFFKSICHERYWYKNDPFILATQATKVFYLEDTKHGGNWRVVQKFAHRHLWSVAENSNDEMTTAEGLSYQDDECIDIHIQPNEVNLDNELLSDEDCLNIDASVVDELRSKREDQQENIFDDEEDETRLQYFSDDERPTIHDDEDEDSDAE